MIIKDGVLQMTERLTIEKFKEIKSQLALIIKQVEESYEANKDKEGYNSDEDEQRYYNQYIISHLPCTCQVSQRKKRQ